MKKRYRKIKADWETIRESLNLLSTVIGWAVRDALLKIILTGLISVLSSLIPNVPPQTIRRRHVIVQQTISGR